MPDAGLDLSPEDVVAVTKAGRADPVWWLDRVLGVSLWKEQKRIVESVRDNRVTAVKTCHAIGKSYVAAGIVHSFMGTHMPALAVTTAPTLRQVRAILWKEIRRMHRNAPLPLGGELTTTSLTYSEDRVGMGFTAPDYDPDRFQGLHSENMLVIVDESAGISEQIFEGVDAILSSGHTRLLMIGNPTDASGRFGRSFDMPSVSKISISAFDTPNFTHFGITLQDIRSGEWEKKITGPLPYPMLINPQWVRERWEDWGEDDPRWEARVLARFPSAGEGALLKLTWIEQAFERHRQIEATAEGWHWQGRIAVDVARLGKDKTERALMHIGQGVSEVIEMQKADTMVTAALVKADRDMLVSDRKMRIDEVRIDADGVGAGVYDRLGQLIGPHVVEIRSGMRAFDPTRFVNQRSEMLWHLRVALDPRGQAPIALPPDPGLEKELAAIRFVVNGQGKIQIEPKDEIKKRIGRSPDKADAVAYAVAPLSGLMSDLARTAALVR